MHPLQRAIQRYRCMPTGNTRSQLFAIFLLSLALAGCDAGSGGLRPAPIARVEFDPIAEMSGMVKHPNDGSYWVHNDSGDAPRLFAIDLDGNTLVPQSLQGRYYAGTPERGKQPWPGVMIGNAENIDWEDITSDGENLYIADLGNNFNSRRNLGVYVVPWSSLLETESAEAAVHWPVAYLEQTAFPPPNRHFDSESLFFADGKLYFITKHREPLPAQSMAPGANLYRLDSTFYNASNPLILVDSHAELTAATAAELSPDGNTLAVLSYTALWLFDRPSEGDQWLSSSSRKIEFARDTVRQAEALAWEDNDTLILSNEQRDIFRIPVAVF